MADDLYPKIASLPNIGKTCYVNSLLQLLSCHEDTVRLFYGHITEDCRDCYTKLTLGQYPEGKFLK